MALKVKKIKKKKSQDNVISKKKKGKAVIEEDLCDNPFMHKEEIKPFNLNIECETDEEVEKDTFKELLKRRIKQMNKRNKENIENDESDPLYEEIENSGKDWYQDKLVNDVPRKLKIF